MTIMNFGPNGWYNPRPDHASRCYRADAPHNFGQTRATPIEKRDVFELIDAARRGDSAAIAELRARDGKATR